MVYLVSSPGETLPRCSPLGSPWVQLGFGGSYDNLSYEADGTVHLPVDRGERSVTVRWGPVALPTDTLLQDLRRSGGNPEQSHS